MHQDESMEVMKMVSTAKIWFRIKTLAGLVAVSVLGTAATTCAQARSDSVIMPTASKPSNASVTIPVSPNVTPPPRGAFQLGDPSNTGVTMLGKKPVKKTEGITVKQTKEKQWSQGSSSGKHISQPKYD